MLKIKIDGKEYQYPASWKEVTVKQFMELKQWNGIDFISLLCIITGVDYPIMFRTKTNDVDELLAPTIKFITRPFNDSNLPSASKITIGSIDYDVPTDLTEYTLGQKIEAQKAIQDAMTEHNDLCYCISKVVSIYMQPIVSGKEFDVKEAIAFESEIDKCSILEAYSVAKFFFVKLNALPKEKVKPWYRRLRQMRKLRALTS